MAAKTEAQIRGELKFARLMTGYLPVGAVRWLTNLALYSVELPAGIRTERLKVAGVPCEWFTSDSTPDAPVILYLHGGGFVYGAAHLHRKMVAQLVKLTGTRALMVDYRLAPEYPFPAPLDDCVKVYTALLDQGISPERMVIAGDSAGGNLTLGTLLTARDQGLPLPAAGVCLSPAVDMTEHDVEKWTTSPDALLHPRAVRYFLDSYVARSDAADPRISPVFADLRGLPPLLVTAGADEGLHDDIVRLAAAAKAQGAALTLQVTERMWHVWQLYYPDLPQAVESLERIAAFIVQHVAQPAPAQP